MTPPRMLRIVPFGERHIFFRPNSVTRASSGVIVAHFTPDAVPLDGVRRVDRHLVVGGVPVLHGQVVIVELDIQVGQDQLVLDELPDDPRHLVTVEFDDGVRYLDLGHGPRSLQVPFIGLLLMAASARPQAPRRRTPRTPATSAGLSPRRQQARVARRQDQPGQPGGEQRAAHQRRSPARVLRALPGDEHAERDARQHDQVGQPGQPPAGAAVAAARPGRASRPGLGCAARWAGASGVAGWPRRRRPAARGAAGTGRGGAGASSWRMRWRGVEPGGARHPVVARRTPRQSPARASVRRPIRHACASRLSAAKFTGARPCRCHDVPRCDT